jgi:hypothetical protein
MGRGERDLIACTFNTDAHN